MLRCLTGLAKRVEEYYVLLTDWRSLQQELPQDAIRSFCEKQPQVRLAKLMLKELGESYAKAEVGLAEGIRLQRRDIGLFLEKSNREPEPTGLPGPDVSQLHPAQQ